MMIRFEFLNANQAQKLVLSALNSSTLIVAQLAKKRVNSHLPRIESRLKNLKDLNLQLEGRYQDLRDKPEGLYDSLAAAKNLHAQFAIESKLLKNALAIEDGAKDTFIRVTLSMAKVTTMKNSKILANNKAAADEKNTEVLNDYAAIKSKKEEIDSKYAVILAAFARDNPSAAQNKEAEAALTAIKVLVKQFDVMTVKFTSEPQSEYIKFLNDLKNRGFLDEENILEVSRRSSLRHT